MRTSFVAAVVAVLGATWALADDRGSTRMPQSGSMGTQSQPGSMGGMGGSAQAGTRKLAQDSVGKAVDMKEQITIYRPEELTWVDAPPALPKGAKMAILEGDPSMSNKHYALRLRLPANYRVAPHYHPTDERITVLSGNFLVGDGEKVNPSAYKTFTTGAFYGVPAGMVHYAQARSELTLQISGVGPFDLVYINPSDDPRTGTGGAGSQGMQQNTPETNPRRVK